MAGLEAVLTDEEMESAGVVARAAEGGDEASDSIASDEDESEFGEE